MIYRSKETLTAIVSSYGSVPLGNWHTGARTHARIHAITHACTHSQTDAHTGTASPSKTWRNVYNIYDAKWCDDDVTLPLLARLNAPLSRKWIIVLGLMTSGGHQQPIVTSVRLAFTSNCWVCAHARASEGGLVASDIVYMYACKHTHTHTHTSVYVRACHGLSVCAVCVCLRVCVFLCTRLCTYVYAYIYASVRVHAYIYTCYT